MNEKYDVAMIRQIMKDNQLRDVMLDRVVLVLVPHASYGENAHKPEAWEESRKIAAQLISDLFDQGALKCPKCGADSEDAQHKCPGDGNCPVSIEG